MSLGDGAVLYEVTRERLGRTNNALLNLLSALTELDEARKKWESFGSPFTLAGLNEALNHVERCRREAGDLLGEQDVLDLVA